VPEAEEPKEEGKGKAPGKKKKLILFAAIGVVVALAGGGAFFIMSKGDAEAPKSEAEIEMSGEAGHGEEPKKEESGGHGGGHGESSSEAAATGEGEPADTYAFERAFMVTLADADAHRQLQFHLALELSDPKFKDQIEQRIHRFRDAVYTTVANRTRAEVISREGMDMLRRDLTRRFDTLLGEDGAVTAVLFSDYLPI